MTDKPMCKDGAVDPLTGETLPEYGKLYKQLGTNNRNKGDRQAMQEKLTAKVESPISPTMWIGLNPRYHLKPNMDKSHAMETFTGQRQ